MGSPLIDMAKSIYTSLSPSKSAREKKYQGADPGMVKEANESFAKKAEADEKAAKKTPQKKMPRKR